MIDLSDLKSGDQIVIEIATTDDIEARIQRESDSGKLKVECLESGCHYLVSERHDGMWVELAASDPGGFFEPVRGIRVVTVVRAVGKRHDDRFVISDPEGSDDAWIASDTWSPDISKVC